MEDVHQRYFNAWLDDRIIAARKQANKEWEVAAQSGKNIVIVRHSIGVIARVVGQLAYSAYLEAGKRAPAEARLEKARASIAAFLDELAARMPNIIVLAFGSSVDGLDEVVRRKVQTIRQDFQRESELQILGILAGEDPGIKVGTKTVAKGRKMTELTKTGRLSYSGMNYTKLIQPAIELVLPISDQELSMAFARFKVQQGDNKFNRPTLRQAIRKEYGRRASYKRIDALYRKETSAKPRKRGRPR